MFCRVMGNWAWPLMRTCDTAHGHFPNRPAETLAENSGFEEITDLLAEYTIFALNSPKIDVIVPQ